MGFLILWSFSLFYAIFSFLFIPDVILPQIEVYDLFLNHQQVPRIDIFHYNNLVDFVTPNVFEYNWRTPFNMIRFINANNPETLVPWTPSPELLASLSSHSLNSPNYFKFLNTLSSPYKFTILNVSCWVVFGIISSK